MAAYIFEQHDMQIESLDLNNIRKMQKLKSKLYFVIQIKRTTNVNYRY